MAKNPKELEATQRLMGALVRMKPKPHEELKKKKPQPAGKKVAKTAKK